MNGLRDRIAGRTARSDAVPFAEAPGVEAMWVANALNPFQSSTQTMPRTDREQRELHEARLDADRLLQSFGQMSAQRLARQWWWLSGVALLVMTGLVPFVVRSFRVKDT